MTSDPSRDGKGLRALQVELSEILAGLEHPDLGMAAALAEECGEVAAKLLDHHAYGEPLDRAALGGELADVLICLCEIATRHGIDLSTAVEEKAAQVAAKAPEWRKTLGEALERSRRQQDRQH